jgi:hypothetical protein
MAAFFGKFYFPILKLTLILQLFYGWMLLKLMYNFIMNKPGFAMVLYINLFASLQVTSCYQLLIMNALISQESH